jgi:S1-C subfamily serine protease
MDDLNPDAGQAQGSAPPAQGVPEELPAVQQIPSTEAVPPLGANPYGTSQTAAPAADPAYEQAPAYYAASYEAAAENPPVEHQRSGVGAAIAVAIVASLVIGTLAGAVAGFAGARLAGSRSLLVPAKITVVPSKTDEPVIAAAAVAVPSVVNLDVRGGGTSQSQDASLPLNHPNVPTQGTGSGVAYKRAPGGGTYILTNNHVVEGADSIVVRDAAGARHKAKLVGRDPETDIAVVEISDSVPVIGVDNSNNLQVGQLVVAIGSPFGLEHSVTSGVVSALSRSLPDFNGASDGVYPLVNVIQTDAAINPGNSGGALVNRSGQLVGINTAIYSDSGSSGGIGFAIPANTAKRVAEELIRGGAVGHPFLGVVGQTVDEQLSKDESLTVTEGAFVVELTPNTNAVKAGIKKGDVIVSLDGTPIRTMDDLILQVRRHDVGDTVELGIVRGGRKIVLKMTVGTKPAGLDTSQPATKTP